MAAADYKALVQSIYISYFGRPADTFGLASYSAQLDTLKAPLTVNGLTAAYATTPGLKSLIDSFGASPESSALYGTDTVAFVSAIYANVLNRAPDYDGLVFWVTAINSGGLTKGNASLAIMAGAINNTSAQGLVDAALLANKVVIATNFTAAIDTGAELSAYNGNAAAATARDMLKTVTSTTVPATFQTTVDATLKALVDAANVGQQFALTVGIDTLVGGSGNDGFNSIGIAGLSALDSIDGGAGNDTLNITSTGALSTIAGVTVKNVETANLVSGADVNFNVSGWTGLTNLTVTSAATVAETITAATTTSVTVANSTGYGVDVIGGGGALSITTGAAAVTANNAAANAFTSATIVGGSTVTIADHSGTAAATGSSLKSVSLKGNTGVASLTGNGINSVSVASTNQNVTVAAAAGARALGVTLDAVTGGVIADAEATALTVTTKSTAGATTGVTLNAAKAATVAITADKALTITDMNVAAATSISFAGAAKTTVSALTTITALTTLDASASTGGVVITPALAAGVVFKGGAGADTVSLGLSTVVTDMGAGDDTLILTAASLGAAGAATGGAGVDTLSMTAANAGSASGSAAFAGTVSGFEHLTLTGATTSTVDVAQLGNYNYVTDAGVTALTLNNFASAGTLAITAAAAADTVNVVNAAVGTADVLNVVLSKLAAGTTASVTAANVETINITATDTTASVVAGTNTDTLTLVGTSAKSIVVTGNAHLTLVNTGNTAVTSIDASGMTGGITVTAAGTVAETIKGGAAANALTGAMAGDVLIGGAAADVITAGVGAETLTGGAGNDTFGIVATANSNIYATITDASKGDIISFADKGVETFAAAKLTLGATAVFQDFVNLAAVGDGSTNGVISWFQFNGDTYVVEDRSSGASFLNGVDIVVKLTGLIDLTTGVIGDHIVTLA